MYNGINYNLARSLGLDLWWPKEDLLQFEPLKINVRCAVLWFNPQVQDEKTLHGMLSVLKLDRKDLMLVKINHSAPDLSIITKSLQQLKPIFVLQLDAELDRLIGDWKLVRTFSPKHLQKNPQDKPTAYRDLVKLRDLLQNDRAN